MRRLLLPLAMLASLAAAPLAAQVRYYAGLGVNGATALIKDQVVTPIEIRQKIAPALVLGAGLPVGQRYGVGLELVGTSGGTHSEENGIRLDLGTLRTVSATVGLEGPLPGSLRWRGSLGLLKYFPANKQGVFLRGGPRMFIGGLGVEYRRPWKHRLDFTAGTRYEFHRFTTDELKARGFTGSQDVHRLTFLLAIARTSR
ncbi:MAG: hypothetical protein ACREMO_05110 [Gemmatimonadales bacterium]